MSTAVVVLADGFEEIEAITQIDVLRRAGVDVTVAGLKEGPAHGAHGVAVETDRALGAVDFEPDLVVLPGGMPGSERLGNSEAVLDLLKQQHGAGRMIGAICAGTTAVEDRVVADGNVVTSRGPGTALEFALALVERLVGKEKAEELRAAMLVA
jgi:4-methyl-5(b-hydroxyethyl)-thiazole monophosphate biosynthesis